MRRIVPFVLLLAIGCGGGAPKSSKPNADREVKLKGQWIGRVDTTGADSKNEEAVRAVVMAKSFEAVNDLEFPEEDRFAMCAGGFLIEGPVLRDGKDLTLTPETVNGLSLENARIAGLALQSSLTGPMRLTVEEGKICHPPGEYGERLVYDPLDTSLATERVEGSDTYEGIWKVKNVTGVTDSHRARGFDYVLKKTKLRIHADGRYFMRFSYHFRGEWEATKQGIRLKYPSGTMNLTLRSGSLVLASPDGKTSVFLEKQAGW